MTNLFFESEQSRKLVHEFNDYLNVEVVDGWGDKRQDASERTEEKETTIMVTR